MSCLIHSAFRVKALRFEHPRKRPSRAPAAEFHGRIHGSFHVEFTSFRASIPGFGSYSLLHRYSDHAGPVSQLWLVSPILRYPTLRFSLRSNLNDCGDLGDAGHARLGLFLCNARCHRILKDSLHSPDFLEGKSFADRKSGSSCFVHPKHNIRFNRLRPHDWTPHSDQGTHEYKYMFIATTTGIHRRSEGGNGKDAARVGDLGRRATSPVEEKNRRAGDSCNCKPHPQYNTPTICPQYAHNKCVQDSPRSLKAETGKEGSEKRRGTEIRIESTSTSQDKGHHDTTRPDKTRQHKKQHGARELRSPAVVLKGAGLGWVWTTTRRHVTTLPPTVQKNPPCHSNSVSCIPSHPAANRLAPLCLETENGRGAVPWFERRKERRGEESKGEERRGRHDREERRGMDTKDKDRDAKETQRKHGGRRNDGHEVEGENAGRQESKQNEANTHVGSTSVA
ncbi:hypothetical protein C8R45DRAFT_928727 [Mycena sanguinolenta]|nr:hypothetical protein C8R45DRAFT_928727 [Mycena sanguinolenta]